MFIRLCLVGCIPTCKRKLIIIKVANCRKNFSCGDVSKVEPNGSRHFSGRGKRNRLRHDGLFLYRCSRTHLRPSVCSTSSLTSISDVNICWWWRHYCIDVNIIVLFESSSRRYYFGSRIHNNNNNISSPSYSSPSPRRDDCMDKIATTGNRSITLRPRAGKCS